MSGNEKNLPKDVKATLKKIINDEADDKLDETNFNLVKTQLILDSASKNQDSTSNNVNRDECVDECMCKIKEALGLIVEEIKQVDATIGRIADEKDCPYTPKPNDKKEFAKSVEKNSTVCHVIIDELTKQRREINEMLELYEESSQEFFELEAAVETQRDNIKRMEMILESTTKTLENVKNHVEKRHESFELELKTRRARTKTREEILQVFLNWIDSLDEKRLKDREMADRAMSEAIEARNEDRAMLTTAIGQLQQVKKIETLIMTQQRRTATHNFIDSV